MARSSPSIRELKLTAALYAKLKGVVEHVKKPGKLPARIPSGGAQIAMRLLVAKRGTNIKLTKDEQRVLRTIVREKRLPGGTVVLLDEHLRDRKKAPGRKWRGRMNIRK